MDIFPNRISQIPTSSNHQSFGFHTSKKNLLGHRCVSCRSEKWLLSPGVNSIAEKMARLEETGARRGDSVMKHRRRGRKVFVRWKYRCWED
ncbi:hypothetical protein ANTQUA_LOCUS9241 [Anthophora quadrimaculata]